MRVAMECPICRDRNWFPYMYVFRVYHHNRAAHRTLIRFIACGHSLCQSCVHRLVSDARQQGKQMRCFECRALVATSPTTYIIENFSLRPSDRLVRFLDTELVPPQRDEAQRIDLAAARFPVQCHDFSLHMSDDLDDSDDSLPELIDAELIDAELTDAELIDVPSNASTLVQLNHTRTFL